MLVHIVLLDIPSDVPDEAVEALFSEVRTLDQIDGVAGVSVSENISAEEKAHGFDHGFVVTFDGEDARDAYLAHPHHQQVAEREIEPLADDVLVFDYKR